MLLWGFVAFSFFQYDATKLILNLSFRCLIKGWNSIHNDLILCSHYLSIHVAPRILLLLKYVKNALKSIIWSRNPKFLALSLPPLKLHPMVGNIQRAVKHWTIAASTGNYIAMHELRAFFEREGGNYYGKRIVSKESFDSTLEAYNDSSR